jgi:hypothetical protein
MPHNPARPPRGNKRGKRGRGGHNRGRNQIIRDDLDMDRRPDSAIDDEGSVKDSGDEEQGFLSLWSTATY